MKPVEQLAQSLPSEALEQLALALARVDHPGTTTALIHHGQEGEVTDVEIFPASRKIKVRRSRC